MSVDFCTRVTRKIVKHGYEKKVARRIAKFCFIAMMFTCGLFGLFERVKAPIYLNTGFGMHAAGARAGNVSPAFSLIRR
ncbi:hypothetical protein [Methanoregula sp.]|uniref:hypothetical protein n=1 Tax=Methanoregula sp. TaxID=2052170 RepID=UPI003BAF377E